MRDIEILHSCLIQFRCAFVYYRLSDEILQLVVMVTRAIAPEALIGAIRINAILFINHEQKQVNWSDTDN